MVIKQVELQHVCGITSKLPDTGQVEVAFAVNQLLDIRRKVPLHS